MVLVPLLQNLGGFSPPTPEVPAAPVVYGGGYGIGVDPLGSHYPFVNPSDDIEGLFADAYLAHDERDIELPLRVKWAHGFNRFFTSESSVATFDYESSSGIPDAENVTDIWIVDANNKTVFFSPLADGYRGREWGDRLYIHEWFDDKKILRVVQHTAFEDTEDIVSYELDILPTNGVLDERVGYMLPKSVTSLRVGIQTLDGHVDFQNGFNTTLVNDGASTRVNNRSATRILMGAEAGSGRGRFDDCDSEVEPIIRMFNGVAPTEEGDFYFDASECYWAEAPSTIVDDVAVVTPNTMRINADCTICCECSSFVNVYRGLIRLHERFQELGSRAEGTRDTFRTNKTRWESSKECRESNLVKIHAIPRPGGSVYIQTGMCNVFGKCIGPVDVTLTFEDFGTAVGLVGSVPAARTFLWQSHDPSKSRRVYYDMGGEYPEYTAHWDAASPGFMPKLRTEVELPIVEEGGSSTVTAVFTAEVDGNIETFSASTTFGWLMDE